MPTSNDAKGRDIQPDRPDILFFFCPYMGHPPPHRFDITLGAGYLAAYLKKKGLKAGFYYGWYDNDPDFGQIRAHIEGCRPRCVGFTVYGSNLPETVALSRVIKKAYPHIPILWGGPDVRFNPQRLVEKYPDGVDVCISGEGEKPLATLLSTNTPFSDDTLAAIPGTCFLNRDTGKIIYRQPGRTLLEDHRDELEKLQALDIYPSPYLEGVIPADYYSDKTVSGIFTSRGCPFKCIYCQFSSLTHHQVLFHSVERVLAEIEWIHARVRARHPDKDAIMIMIYDEALTLSRKRIETLCHRLIEADFNPPLKLWIDTRADHVDEALLALLRRAGAKKINFGLESAVPRVLKIIGKVAPHKQREPDNVDAESRFLDSVQKAVMWSKAQGLFTSVSIIVGLPGETLADAEQTLGFVKKLDADHYSHNFLNVLEGTELAQQAGRWGYEWQDFPRGYMGKYGHRYTKAPIATRSLQPLGNAMEFQRDRNRFGFLLRGWYYGLKCAHLADRSTPFKPFVLGIDTHPQNSPFSKKFLSTYLGFSVTLFCPQALYSGDDDFLRLFADFPLGNGRLYLLPQAGEAPARIRGIEEADHSTPYYLAFKTLDRTPIPDDGRRVFVTVEDGDDVECLSHVMDSLSTDGNITLSHDRYEALPFDLFESCRWFRWFDMACPARWLTHLYADARHNLRPCVHFPAVGRVQEHLPLVAFRQRIAEQIQSKLRTRGCLQCRIKDNCPQCIAPFPLTDSEYCRFQKRILGS